MNPEIERQIVDILELSKKAGVQAADFLAQQAPELVEQILRWELASSIMWGSFDLIIIIGTIYLCKHIWSLVKGQDYAPVIMFPIFLTVMFSCFLSTYIHKIVKVCVAPKLVILEKMREIAR